MSADLPTLGTRRTILMLNQEFPPIEGGAANACSHLCRELAALGHSVHVITSRPGRACAADERVVRVPVRGYRGGAFTLGQLLEYRRCARAAARALLARERVDIVHAFFSWPGGALAAELGLPYIVSLRGSDVPGFRFSRWHPLYLAITPTLRRVWRGARAVVANSAALRTLAAKTWRGRIEVIPNGVDAGCFDLPRTPGADRVVLSVCQLIPRKNVDRLIAALPDVQRRCDRPVRLRIVGRGRLEPALRRLAAALGVDSRVEFIDGVPADAMPAVYAGADVFALASSREGMSNALLEAMASGLPCVTTRAGDADRLIESGTHGLVLGDGASWADALVALLNDPAARERMGAAARARAKADFGWARMARMYDASYG